jgi:hypothetical protein
MREGLCLPYFAGQVGDYAPFNPYELFIREQVPPQSVKAPENRIRQV